MNQSEIGLRMPIDWAPQEPAWEVAFPDDLVATAVYLGCQGDDLARAAFLDKIRTMAAGSDGPVHCDFARFVDAAGITNDVGILYWARSGLHEAWLTSSGFGGWWDDAARNEEPCGYWQERYEIPRQRLETIVSQGGQRRGLGAAFGDSRGPMQRHGYGGASRDRIPLSEVDGFTGVFRILDAPAPQRPADGTRRKITVPENFCAIRSGQDWSGCEPAERSLYLDEVEPALVAGMNYLRDGGYEIGCASCRFMQALDDDGSPLEQSFGLAQFGDLRDLEAWSANHPTHHAIMDKFLTLVRASDGNIGLLLWHEIILTPAGGAVFEYINCHSWTGVLKYEGTTNAWQVD